MDQWYQHIATAIMAIGTFIATKWMYKEIYVRLILATIAPGVFMLIGPLFALLVHWFISLVLGLLAIIGISSNIPHTHTFGVSLVITAGCFIHTLHWYSKRESKH